MGLPSFDIHNCRQSFMRMWSVLNGTAVEVCDISCFCMTLQMHLCSLNCISFALYFTYVTPVPDMTYNVFGGTLSLTQSINQSLM